MKIGTHRQSETTIGLFLNTPRSRFVVPSFLTSIKPLSPDLKGGGRHACHAEKCKWQRSREKEERARLEVETLLSPLTEAIPPPDPRPHISGWTLNPWPHQWGRVPPRVVHAHTVYLQTPSGLRAGSHYLEIVSVSVCGGFLPPRGKAQRAGAWSLCEMLMWNQTGWTLSAAMCEAVLVGER